MASRFLSKILERPAPLAFRSANKLLEVPNSMFFSTASTRPAKISGRLFSRIVPLGDPDSDLTRVLDLCVKERGEVRQQEIREITRFLRGRRRYTQALGVSEWMSTKGIGTTSTSDHAIRLDLIGRVRGLESAENYFNSLNPEDLNEKTYGALLGCYVRESNVDKSLLLIEKAKGMGLPLSCLEYNNLMVLYANSGELEKIPAVFSEMKEKGITPNNFSYRNLIRAYGKCSDLVSVEEVLQEMEIQPSITMDWQTYSAVANVYIDEGIKEKAMIYLKQCEATVGRDALGYNYLISLYTSLGEKDEIWRLWNLQKTMFKKQNNSDYIVMLASLVKLDELEEAKKLLDEWESSCQTCDFRVPNVLLIGYCQKGFVEEAEAILRRIVNNERKTAIPNSWSIITAGYIDKQDMKKAFECFKEALALQDANKGWRPKPNLVSAILKWLGDHGDVEKVEDFVKRLGNGIEVKGEMYQALLKTYIRCGQGVDRILERMKADGIENDEETEKILSSSNFSLLGTFRCLFN